MELLTVGDIVNRLAIGEGAVLALIRSGALPATNISRPGSQRPIWRIAEADLDRFLAARRTVPSAGTRAAQ